MGFSNATLSVYVQGNFRKYGGEHSDDEHFILTSTYKRHIGSRMVHIRLPRSHR